MRVLLDESLPDELKNEIPGRSAGRADVFLTADQNLEYQQNLRNLPVAVIVVFAKTNRIEEVRPLIPRILEHLAKLAPRTLVRVAA